MRASVVGLLAVLGATGCAPRDRLCAAEDPCGGGRACVSGRCVAAGRVPKLFEVDDAGSPTVKRWTLAPTDVAWLSPRAPEGGGVPAIGALGGPSGGTLLLRFGDLKLPPEVVEAYVMLRRAPDLDPPVGLISLRAHRIEGDWEARSLWRTRPPPLVDAVGPETRVTGSAGDVVRVDVRALVLEWARPSPRRQGIAIVATGEARAPLYVALASGAEPQGPVLEIYAR